MIRRLIVLSALVAFGFGCSDNTAKKGHVFEPSDTGQVDMNDDQGSDVSVHDLGRDASPEIDMTDVSDMGTDLPIDFASLDSDGDGLLDSEEGRATNRDTDGDGTPDYLDLDSDDDGLSDQDESTIYGTLPTMADSDSDGSSDLIEVAVGTDPNDASDNPEARGWVTLVLADAQPVTAGARFETWPDRLDAYLLFDISGSMGAEISAIGGALSAAVSNLECSDSGIACLGDGDCAAGESCNPFSKTCVTGSTAAAPCVRDPWVGAGYYEDMYWHGADLTDNVVSVTSEINSWSTFGGTENLYQALIGVADRTAAGALECGATLAGFVGCPNYREEALRLVLAATDEDSDGATTASQAGTALSGLDITLIGLNSGNASARDSLRVAAQASGSLDAGGIPLVFDGADAAVVTALQNGVEEVAFEVPRRVSLELLDAEGDALDVSDFVLSAAADTTTTGCFSGPTQTVSNFADFPAVDPGAEVCWTLEASNPSTSRTDEPQVARGTLTAYSKNSPTDRRELFIIIPPAIP